MFYNFRCSKIRHKFPEHKITKYVYLEESDSVEWRIQLQPSPIESKLTQTTLLTRTKLLNSENSDCDLEQLFRHVESTASRRQSFRIGSQLEIDQNCSNENKSDIEAEEDLILNVNKTFSARDFFIVVDERSQDIPVVYPFQDLRNVTKTICNGSRYQNRILKEKKSCPICPKILKIPDGLNFPKSQNSLVANVMLVPRSVPKIWNLELGARSLEFTGRSWSFKN